jgi:hypothetical protein
MSTEVVDAADQVLLAVDGDIPFPHLPPGGTSHIGAELFLRVRLDTLLARSQWGR